MWAKAWAQAPLMARWVPSPTRSDHVTDLADDVVSEQAAAVVLQHRVNDAVKGHRHSQRHQNFHPGKTAAESIDGCFGRERAHEDGAVESGFAIGVGQPGMQGRHGGVENKPDHDQPGASGRMRHVEDRRRPSCRRSLANEGECPPGEPRPRQRAPAGNGNPAAMRLRAAPEPDQEHGREGHQFPERERGSAGRRRRWRPIEPAT